MFARLFSLVVVVCMLSACGPTVPGHPMSPYQYITDQSLRSKLFHDCMTVLPAGPVQTHYNDWSEVVDSCESSSFAQAKRLATQDKNGAWVWADVK